MDLEVTRNMPKKVLRTRVGTSLRMEFGTFLSLSPPSPPTRYAFHY